MQNSSFFSRHFDFIAEANRLKGDLHCAIIKFEGVADIDNGVKVIEKSLKIFDHVIYLHFPHLIEEYASYASHVRSILDEIRYDLYVYTGGCEDVL